MRLLFLILLFSTTFNTYALNDNSFAYGWYWGKDEVINERKDKSKKATHKVIKPQKTKKQELEDISKEVDEAKAKAILEPSDENIVNYIKIQEKVINLSSNFGAAWAKVLVNNPGLSYLPNHSDNMLAQQIIKDEKRKSIDNIIHDFSKENGLIFFFEGKNRLSNAQSKIIKSFVERYKVALIPVSVDGQLNEIFPNAQKDNKRSKLLGIDIFPSILAINIKTNKYTPIAFGVISESDLANRINDVLNNFEGIKS